MIKEIEIPEGYEARIEGNKVIIELKESEDERIRKHIIDIIKDNAKSKCIPCDAEIVYLEKQKEQKPVKYGDDVVEEAEEYTSKVDCGEYGIAVTEAYIAGVLAERNRKPAEWSEDDENWSKYLLDELYAGLKDYCGAAEKDMKEAIKWFKTRLKFLRPRPNWKPSEEEMKALWVIEDRMRTNKAFALSNRLASLYNDLQKLL